MSDHEFADDDAAHGQFYVCISGMAHFNDTNASIPHLPSAEDVTMSQKMATSSECIGQERCAQPYLAVPVARCTGEWCQG